MIAIDTLSADARQAVEGLQSENLRLTRLLGVYSFPGNAVVVVAYAGEATGGALKMDDESLAIRSFPPAEIPWDQLAFPSTVQALRDYLSPPGIG